MAGRHTDQGTQSDLSDWETPTSVAATQTEAPPPEPSYTPPSTPPALRGHWDPPRYTLTTPRIEWREIRL
ncbi:hypothetical protein RF55_18286 [Lasius niger]|uniref:Uncharacterized protein n=1 Tax=Lasius niger TaxID=67767 RepID=A0A0J7K155_LASNI|nr:hypothetical protein RF55_18286 [Lasius niger]